MRQGREGRDRDTHRKMKDRRKREVGGGGGGGGGGGEQNECVRQNEREGGDGERHRE